MAAVEYDIPISDLRVGDKIVEYPGGRRKLIDVKKVVRASKERLVTTCSKNGVHVNDSFCYTAPTVTVSRSE